MRPVRREVADGVFRLGDRLVNWWLVVEGGRGTLVDAGLPRQYGQLTQLLSALAMKTSDIEAVVVTHGHLDHVACIDPLRRGASPVVRVPAGDRDLAAAEPKPDPAMIRHSLNPSGLRTAVSYARQGIARARPVVDAADLRHGETVDAPGRLRFVEAPGHTSGGGFFVHGDGDVVFTGDVLVTLDPFSGRTGPRTLPAFDNVDHDQAVAALQEIGRTGGRTLLPGHGEPWHGDVALAARAAEEASAS